MRTNRFWLLAAVLLLFSCAKDETEDGGGQPVPIQLTTVGLGPATRAADGINTGNFPLETPITVAVDGSNYNYKTDATSVSNPLDCQDAIPPHFPVSGSSVHVVAYYPTSVQYDTEAHPFVVAADQSTDASYAASDLMIGLPQTTFEDGSGNSLIEGTGMARKVKPTSLPIPLEFVHQLSKIKVVVTINGAAVKKVTMKNVMRSVDFKSSTGELSGVKAVATTGLDEVVMYDNTDGTSSGFTTTAIIPQQTLATGTGFIDVVVEDSPSDKTLTYKLKEAGAFVSGSQYIYNLTVSNDEILCTTSVTNWNDATDYTHGDGLAVSRPVLPIEYVAAHNMYNSEKIADNDYISTSSYYQWNSAMTYFNGHKTIKDFSGSILSGKYHLPTVQEWMSIVPPKWTNNTITSNPEIDIDGADDVRTTFGNDVSIQTGLGEKLQWGKRSDNSWVMPSTKFYNEYRTNSSFTSAENGITRKYIYAIRLKKTDVAGPSGYGDYTCAYRYTYTDKDPDCENKASLRVRVKYLGALSTTTLSEIADPDYWSQVGEFLEVILPACGYTYQNGQADGSWPAGTAAQGQGGLGCDYWTVTEQDTYAFNMSFRSTGINGNSYNVKANGFPIRLFRDAD